MSRLVLDIHQQRDLIVDMGRSYLFARLPIYLKLRSIGINLYTFKQMEFLKTLVHQNELLPGASQLMAWNRIY